MRSPWFGSRWCVPSAMPRPTAIFASVTVEAATRGVHFAASAAALSTPSQRGCEMLRLRNSYGSSLARCASSSIIPSCAKKYGGSSGARRAPNFKYPRPGDAMFDHPPVRNVVHVVLRDPDLIEATNADAPHRPAATLPTASRPPRSPRAPGHRRRAAGPGRQIRGRRHSGRLSPVIGSAVPTPLPSCPQA